MCVLLPPLPPPHPEYIARLLLPAHLCAVFVHEIARARRYVEQGLPLKFIALVSHLPRLALRLVARHADVRIMYTWIAMHCAHSQLTGMKSRPTHFMRLCAYLHCATYSSNGLLVAPPPKPHVSHTRKSSFEIAGRYTASSSSLYKAMMYSRMS